MPRIAIRIAFLLLAATALVGGIAGGLLRAGVALPIRAPWAGHALLSHAFLLICAFFGTVIGLERAVAVKKPLAFTGPVFSGLAGWMALRGMPEAASWLAVTAALAFVGVNIVVVNRQRAAHTLLLLVAALAWLAGTLLHATGWPANAVLPWWFAFLVLTIAAERLEMTRLMRRRAGAAAALHALVGLLLGGCVLSGLAGPQGGAVYGASLAGLALWLMRFDIARRTLHSEGLSRYMAVCLLLGDAWLLVAGAAWVATALGLPYRDAALHGLALGFVFSMMLGHAPVILPALVRVKLRFGWPFYLPLALLHGSLLWRLVGTQADLRLLASGALANAGAIALFAVTVVGSALATRLEKPSSPSLKDKR